MVPSRDPESGAPLSGFQKRFAERRAANLPKGTELRFFDHYYRLAVNTRLAKPGSYGTLRRGDAACFDSR